MTRWPILEMPSVCMSHLRVYRAITTLWLLSPQIPLFFQGQEFGSTRHFYYFCDHEKKLAELVNKGRLEFISQFISIDDKHVKTRIPLPNHESTFLNSKLNWKQKDRHEMLRLHKDLIHLRKYDPVFSTLSEAKVDGAVLDENFFLVRYFSSHGERLLLINLGIDLLVEPAAEPLLAPPQGHKWHIKWSSEMPQYGGFGYRKNLEGSWKITGNSATILYPEKKE